MTCFGIPYQFSYLVQEFMLENDTMKNGMSCRFKICKSLPLPEVSDVCFLSKPQVSWSGSLGSPCLPYLPYIRCEFQ